MLKQIHNILVDIFSEKGFSTDGFSIKGKAPFSIEVSIVDDVISINFTSAKPRAKIKKNLGFFTPSLELDVLGIVLKNNSGIIKLKNFIDIPFNYE